MHTPVVVLPHGGIWLVAAANQASAADGQSVIKGTSSACRHISGSCPSESARDCLRISLNSSKTTPPSNRVRKASTQLNVLGPFTPFPVSRLSLQACNGQTTVAPETM